MRESLSEMTATSARTLAPKTRGNGPALAALWAAVGLSAVLAVATIVDQASVHALRDHSVEMYEPYGVPANPGALYAILYTVAVLGALFWIPAIPGARKGRLWSAIVTVAGVVVAGGLALTLFAVSEYGEPLYPPVWGVLALLPPVAGVVAAVLLFRRR